MIRPTVMFAQSINETDAQDLFKKYIYVNKNGANTLQMWYPPIWRSTPEDTIRKTRPILIFSKAEIETVLEDDQNNIKFKLLSPNFIANRYGSEYRWANVINLDDRSAENQLALVFPSNYKQSVIPSLGIPDDKIISSTEGLVIFPRFVDAHAYWKLQSGDMAFTN